ncbi:MAG: ParA family protein [Spirochaetales bacterium]|nr:ParA family protein [Spirochaetales bacterium]
MKIITIGQRKGGNGKSTATLNLAHVFSEEGKKVLIVDLDDQKNTTSALTIDRRQKRTVEDLLTKEDAELLDTVSETNWKGVSLLPASGNLSGVIRQLDGEVGGHLVLKEKLKGAKHQFDIVLIDTSPSLNVLVISALCASDYLFIPLSSKYFSLQGLSQTLTAYRKVKERLNEKLKLLGIAFVIHDRRNVLAEEVIKEVKNSYPALICESIIGINIRIEEAQVSKKSIFEYAPKDRGALQYRKLGCEILKRMEE